MGIETTPEGSFNAVDAMMGILSADERGAEDNQAEPTDEVEQEEEAVADDESDDEADDSEVVEPRVFKVKVDGEEIEVPEDELLKGYSRTQSYTRKTQQLAEERKQTEAEREAARNERQQYASALQQLSAKLQSEVVVDESLQYTDPIAYAQQWQRKMQADQQQQAITQEQQRIAALQQQEQAAYMQKYLAEQTERLTSLIPDWVDQDTAKAEKAKIRDMAKDYGYTDEELSELYDARAVAVMRDAMKYRDLVAKRQEVKPKDSPVVKSRHQPAKSAATQARQRLAKTGSVQDAAAIFRSML